MSLSKIRRREKKPTHVDKKLSQMDKKKKINIMPKINKDKNLIFKLNKKGHLSLSVVTG